MTKPQRPEAEVDALLAAMRHARRPTVDGSPSADSADDGAAAERIADAVLAARASAARTPGVRRSRLPYWVGAAACLVLAVGLVLRGPSTESPVLPAYALEIDGLDREQRGAEPVRESAGWITEGNRLVLRLRPSRAVDAPLEAAVWSRTDTGLQRLALPIQIAESGAVRIEAVLGRELSLSAGPHTLWVTIARPQKTPSPSTIQALNEPTSNPAWSVFPVQLIVRSH